MVDRLKVIGPAAEVFVREASVTKAARNKNNRGSHFFSILGYDRQNKGVSVESMVGGMKYILMQRLLCRRLNARVGTNYLGMRKHSGVSMGQPWPT